MKECKCERRLSDPLDPPNEETMQMACDVLEHHLKLFRELNRRSKLPIEVTEEHIKIINRFMEEKKTKKMTKAEAFEYFKRKRVVCDYSNCVAIQRKFFEVGIKWRGGLTEASKDIGSFLFVDLNGCLTHCNSREWFDRHEYEEISADDILSTEIVDEKYELEFNYDKVVELAKPLMHYLNEVGFQDSIRVSQLGIVHEPMSTLIFDPSIGE